MNSTDMKADIREYLSKMPKELKDRYEFVRYKFGTNWRDSFYKQSLDYLETNEKILNPKPLFNYDGTQKQRERIQQEAKERAEKHKHLQLINK